MMSLTVMACSSF